MKTRMASGWRAIAWVVCLMVGVAAGTARGQLLTKAMVAPSDSGSVSRYPVDHMAAGSGIGGGGGGDPTSATGPCHNGREAICYKCTATVGGRCASVCYGSSVHCAGGGSTLVGHFFCLNEPFDCDQGTR